MVAVAILRADPESVSRSGGGSPLLRALEKTRRDFWRSSTRRPTHAEPLQRHDLSSLPNSSPGPSKQIIHWELTGGGGVASVRLANFLSQCLPLGGTSCHVRFSDFLLFASVWPHGSAFDRAGDHDGEGDPLGPGAHPTEETNQLGVILDLRGFKDMESRKLTRVISNGGCSLHVLDSWTCRHSEKSLNLQHTQYLPVP